MLVLTSVLRITSQGGGAYDNGQKYGARNHGDHELSGVEQNGSPFGIALILPEPLVFGSVARPEFQNADDSFPRTFAP